MELSPLLRQTYAGSSMAVHQLFFISVHTSSLPHLQMVPHPREVAVQAAWGLAKAGATRTLSGCAMTLPPSGRALQMQSARWGSSVLPEMAQVGCFLLCFWVKQREVGRLSIPAGSVGQLLRKYEVDKANSTK